MFFGSVCVNSYQQICHNPYLIKKRGAIAMNITYVDDPNGARLRLTSAKIIRQNGLNFKYLEGTGQLLP